MSTYPRSPRLLKAGLVLLDARTSAVTRVIALQYNPETLSRTLTPRGVEGDGASRGEALRLTGPPVETLSLEAVIDATDRLENPDRHPDAVATGIHAQLAALETLVYPESSQLEEASRLSRAGTIEIAPMETHLTLFVWSVSRVLPVRVTQVSVTEEAFDPALNPIRARVSLELRVLTGNDLPPEHRGTGLFRAHHQQKEGLARRVQGALGGLGITDLP